MKMVKLWVSVVGLYAILGWIPFILLFNLVPVSMSLVLFGLWLTADVTLFFLGPELIDYQSLGDDS